MGCRPPVLKGFWPAFSAATPSGPYLKLSIASRWACGEVASSATECGHHHLSFCGCWECEAILGLEASKAGHGVGRDDLLIG